MRSKEELIKVVEEYQKLLINNYDRLLFNQEVKFNTTNLFEFLVSYFREVRLKPNNSLESYSTIDDEYRSEYYRDRSIGDLFLIARGNYKEDITLLEVMEAMYIIVETNYEMTRTDFIHIYICPSINKYVFWRNSADKDGWEPYKYRGYNYSSKLNYNYNEFNIHAGDYIALFDNK